jgi:hypothetical protein
MYLHYNCGQTVVQMNLLHFVAFFHVASMFSTGVVDNEKMGVENGKALELDYRIFVLYFSLI